MTEGAASSRRGEGVARSAAASDADEMGMAAEGARYRIEGEIYEEGDDDDDDALNHEPAASRSTNAAGSSSSTEGQAPPASAAPAVAEGEPPDGLSDAEGVDGARASFLRRARKKATSASSASKSLPFIPSSSSSAASSKSRSSQRPAQRRSRRATCLLYLRVLSRWSVLKHLLACLVLPVLCSLAAVYYFFFMPTAGMGLSEALLAGDQVTARWFLVREPSLLDGPLPPEDFGGEDSGEEDVGGQRDQRQRQQQEQKRWAIHLAALGNNTHMVEYLLTDWGDRGVRRARVDARDAQGLTALHYACAAGNVPMAMVLLEAATASSSAEAADADANANPAAVLSGVDLGDLHGRTALHFAAISGHADLMVLLVLNGGADPLRPDRDGRTPIDYARMLHPASSGDALQKLLNDAGVDSEQEEEEEEEDEEQEEEETVATTTKPKRQRRSDRKAKKTAVTRKKKKKVTKKKPKRTRQQANVDPVAVATPATATAAAATPPLTSQEDEDAALMALFTGEESAAAANTARFERAQAHQAHQREVAAELERLKQTGQMDDDEFSV